MIHNHIAATTHRNLTDKKTNSDERIAPIKKESNKKIIIFFRYFD